MDLFIGRIPYHWCCCQNGNRESFVTNSSVFLCAGGSTKGAPERTTSTSTTKTTSTTRTSERPVLCKRRRKLFGLSGSPSCPSYVCWSVVRLAAKQKKQFDGFTFRELCSLAKHDNKVSLFSFGSNLFERWGGSLAPHPSDAMCGKKVDKNLLMQLWIFESSCLWLC